MKTTAKIKITDAMQRELNTLLATKGAARFRRSELATRLYPFTNPRNLQRADAQAEAVIKAFAREGKIVRSGHVHWVRAGDSRKLLSGRPVTELPDTMELPISTHCPEKWVSVDMETGDIWHGTKAGWKRATATVVADLGEIVKPSTRDAEVSSLIEQIWAAESIAMRDSLFEKIIDVWEKTARRTPRSRP